MYMAKIGAGDVYIEEPKREVEKENAVDYLIRVAKENSGEITIVAIAPLTNIAHCILKNNEFVKNVKRLIIMGGSMGKGNITEFAEFNLYKDPEAARIVFEAGFKEIVMIGLDVTNKSPLIDKFEDILNNENDKVAKFLYDITRKGAVFDRESLGLEGFVLHDSLTIAYLLNNGVIKLKDAFVSIITEGEEIGKSVVENNTETPNCKVAYEVDRKLFYEILFNNIFPEKAGEVKEIISGL